jgi:hypothetical protein
MRVVPVVKIFVESKTTINIKEMQGIETEREEESRERIFKHLSLWLN